MSTATLPSAGFFSEVIEPAGAVTSPQFAQELLSLHLKETAKNHIRELLQKKNAGLISSDEQALLDEYLLAGEVLDLLHAQARMTLRGCGVSDS